MWRAPMAERTVFLFVVLAAFFVFCNAFAGDFVYDDRRQILRNTLIQDDASFWRALRSDVWAFKGGAGASDYWRPSFVLWLMLGVRLFGLEDATGWHVANAVLHAVVVALSYLLVRRLHVSAPTAAAIALLFAVHPIHVESVAWISGAPDLLMGAALLGSLLCAQGLGRRPTPALWAGALGLFLIALGAKESAILFPGVVAALPPAERSAAVASDAKRRSSPATGTWLPALSTRGLRLAAPFGGVAAVYFAARFAVLGRVAQSQPGAAGLDSSFLTAPLAFSFYLRQIVVPLRLAPSYSIRPVTAGTLAAFEFIGSLVVATAAMTGMLWLARRSPIARVGLALFALTLAPAMNTGIFPPEQIVHDRYLYLPLLGFLMLIVPAIADGLERARWLPRERGAGAVLAGAIVCAVPLALGTITYDRVWRTDLSLWEWGVRSDPGSAWNLLQYGSALEQAGRFEEARTSIDRSLTLRELPAARLVRARVSIAQGRFVEAQRDLELLIDGGRARVEDAYTLYQAYEALAVAYQDQRRFENAVTVLRQARIALPVYSAALTEKLSVMLYVTGRKAEALGELEAARAQARVETLPESRDVWYRLALLYAEAGRVEDALAAAREYLESTAGQGDPIVAEARAQMLDLVRRQGGA